MFSTQPDTTHRSPPPFLSHSAQNEGAGRREEDHEESWPLRDASDDDPGGASAHGGPREKSPFWFLYILLSFSWQRVRLGLKKTKWKKAHPKCTRPPTNDSQDMAEKKKKSEIYQVMFFLSHGSSVLKLPLVPSGTSPRGQCRGRGRGKPTPKVVPSQPPRSHLAFYNLFGS